MAAQRQISEVLTTLAAVRFAAGPMILAWLIILVIYEAEWWRFVLVVIAVPPVAWLALAVHRQAGLTAPRLIATLLFSQSCGILATGGIDSPMFPAVVAASVMIALAVGGFRIALPFVLGIIAVVTLTALAEGAWDLFGYDFLGQRTRLGHWLTAGVMITAVTVATLIGSRIGSALVETERRAAAFQSEALRMARGRNEELVLLSGALAHELKNPLAAVQGLTTFMRDECDPHSDQAEQLAIVVQEVHRMTDIVTSFLNFSRPLSPERLSRVRLAPLARAVADLHAVLARAETVETRVAVPDALAVRGDSRKLRQVLVNLLQNALAFAPAGSVVHIHGEVLGETVFIYLDDEGPGVPVERREAVFQAGMTTRDTGSGLGLAIARRLTRSHGGELSIQAAPGGGCRGCLALPVGGPTPAGPKEAT